MPYCSLHYLKEAVKLTEGSDQIIDTVKRVIDKAIEMQHEDATEEHHNPLSGHLPNPNATDNEIKRAKEMYWGSADIQNDDINIDENATAIRVDDGVWVAAWLWLPNADDSQYLRLTCRHCGETYPKDDYCGCPNDR